MNTYLGAGEYLSVNDLNVDSIKDANILYMEGYLWDKPSSKEAFLYAAKLNKETGGMNAISLSDVFCVDMHRESFKDFIKNDIDYVFCNEDELNSLFELNNIDESIENFLNLFPNVKQLICTLGSSGVIIIEKGRSYHFDATEANVVDKTGAGDFFAGGGLLAAYAILAAHIGNISGSNQNFENSQDQKNLKSKRGRKSKFKSLIIYLDIRR